MAYLVQFGFAVLIQTGFLVQVHSYPERYISVASDVHKFYRTSSILFVSSRNNRSLEDYTSAQSLGRDSLQQYDFTSIIHFDQLDQYTKRYQKRISRPLVVVFLRSTGDIAEFTGNAKFTSEPYIWLVVFDNQSGSSALCEYCKSPEENSLRLRFDTEMLVLCCDSLVLKKWWSIDGYHTEVSDVAAWTDEKRDKLIFLDPAVLDARRYDTKGVKIRIGLFESSIFAYEIGDEFQGFFGHILNELKRSMNFTITKVVRSPSYGTLNSQTKKWSGLIGRVTQGEVDLAVTEFVISKERLNVLDFTVTLLTSQSQLVISDQRTSGDEYWTAFFQVFSADLWIVTIVLIIVVTLLLAVMEVFKSSRSLPFLVVERYLDVWGIFCQQGLSEFPARSSLRVAYFSILILALTIYTAYSAKLVSFLAISLPRLPFTSLEGFVNDGSYRLITLKNSAYYDFVANSTDPVLKKMMKLMKPMAELPESVSAAWEQVCRGKVAYYTGDFTKLMSQARRCNITSIDTGYKTDLAMSMPAGSQYSRAINYQIQRFKDTGLIDRLKHKYYNIEYPSAAAAAAEFSSIYMQNVIPVLVILIGGLILALLVLLSETMYNAVKTYRRNRRRGKTFKNSRPMTFGKDQLPFIN